MDSFCSHFPNQYIKLMRRKSNRTSSLNYFKASICIGWTTLDLWVLRFGGSGRGKISRSRGMLRRKGKTCMIGTVRWDDESSLLRNLICLMWELVTGRASPMEWNDYDGMLSGEKIRHTRLLNQVMMMRWSNGSCGKGFLYYTSFMIRLLLAHPSYGI